VALFAALLVVAISSSLILVILGYAVSSARDSGRDRGRSIAVATVEGVVDATYARLQTSDPDNLPCDVAPAGVLAAGPDGSTAQATVRYLRADGTSLTSGSTCLPAGYAAQDVAGAVITVSGTTAARTGLPAGTRKMESYVKLTPVYAQDNSLGKAIYASGSVAFTNNATLLGDQGADADVYAGAAFQCTNSLDLAGSLYVQGDTSFTNTCSVQGDLHSLGNVSINNRSTIGGRIISTTGYADLNNPSITVGGVLQTAGAIYGKSPWNTCGLPKCQEALSPGPPAPPTEPFPILQWDAATQNSWLAAGYTNVVTLDDCSESGGPNAATQWFLDDAASLSAKTVLLTNCEIKLSGDEIELGNDLLIMAKGGFTSSNATQISSTVPGTSRNLHWVVPYDTTARPCTNPQMSTSQQFGVTEDVRMFLYSPCNIHFANQSTQIGQIYGGGNVTVSNRFTLQFRPVPVFGVQLPVSSTVVESFKVDIVYKRETG